VRATKAGCSLASVPSVSLLMKRTPPLLKWSARLLLCLGLELAVLLVADTLHLQFKPTSESTISEAELQEAKNWLGVNLTPEELTSVDLTDEMRDRLRADPRAQPILQALRKDLIRLKWGVQQGESLFVNPIWQTYGVKSFPLLNYFTQSKDPVRQDYGMQGILALGKPYTTLWLKKLIQSPSNEFSFYWIQSGVVLHQGPNFNERQNWSREIWQRDYGLDDPKTREEIIRLARKNLRSDTTSSYEKNFNLRLLSS
jgi:hypothetical protein